MKALQQATSTVPMVFISVAEPVAQGFVQSLARPGANITGFAFLEQTVGAKRLDLLTEIAPRVKRIAYIFSPKAAPYAQLYYESAASARREDGRSGNNPNPVNRARRSSSRLLRSSVLRAARYRVPAVYGNLAGNQGRLDCLHA